MTKSDPHPEDSPVEDATVIEDPEQHSKKELVERAAELGIEGHLSMSRAELAEAIRRA